MALALPLAAQAKPCSPGEGDGAGDDAGDPPRPTAVWWRDVRVRVGDSVKIGDPIATVGTSKTYAASTDGTVSGVFAREGDSADGVKPNTAR